MIFGQVAIATGNVHARIRQSALNCSSKNGYRDQLDGYD